MAMVQRPYDGFDGNIELILFKPTIENHYDLKNIDKYIKYDLESRTLEIDFESANRELGLNADHATVERYFNWKYSEFTQTEDNTILMDILNSNNIIKTVNSVSGVVTIDCTDIICELEEKEIQPMFAVTMYDSKGFPIAVGDVVL